MALQFRKCHLTAASALPAGSHVYVTFFFKSTCCHWPPPAPAHTPHTRYLPSTPALCDDLPAAALSTLFDIYIYICLLLLFLFHMISDQCFIAMAVTAMTLSPSLVLAHAGYHRSRRATTPTPSPMQRHSDISLHNRRYHPTVAPSSCRSCNRPRCGQSDVRTAT
ncbi:hypothetical protein EI94DRAFT_1019507 [Lactarius quietus]|nr:hypothetical protein EI94DRAFT_1019507 [Lactarius quietus]